MAGMVMCVLSVVATSSCSKEDFFGLNEYETLDYSKMTEIALSQEFTDYYTACIEVGKVINQWNDSIDATKGAPQNYTGESLVKLLERLKEAYPELLNADGPDFDEIRRIALSSNKTLKALAQNNRPSANTRSFEYNAGNYGNKYFYSDSEGCISYLNYIYGRHPDQCMHFSAVGANGYDLYSCYNLDDAVYLILSRTWENGNNYNALCCGGFVFSEGAIAVLRNGEQWPEALSYLPVTPEKDFYFVNVTAGTLTQGQITYLEASYGPGPHVLLDLNGEVIN